MSDPRLDSLHYKSFGLQDPAAPTLFLLHGMGGGHWVWRQQINAFARWRLIAVDLAGHGDSPQPTPRRVHEHVPALLRLADSLSAQRAVWCGHSLGGAIAMELALQRPERADALILIGAAPEFDVPPERVDLMRNHSAEARTDRRWLPWSDATPAEVRTAYMSAGPAAPSEVVLSDLEALARFKITGLLPDIACPVLVITGAEDRYIDKIRLERQYLPRARYHEIESAGHIVMWEQPEATNRLIGDFLDTLG
ncbi:MAG: alpha/beta fold hydrolase [Betaproteobacteria bacterium]|nr:alpha/beta fold hydrolase [Betaproteobacteria bacterium]